MQPIPFAEANTTLYPPAGEEDRVSIVHALVEDGRTTTIWRPTMEEIITLQNGGGVALTLWGNTMPPACLFTVSLSYDPVPEETNAATDPRPGAGEALENPDDLVGDGPVATQ